jgi:hypothetical protein
MKPGSKILLTLAIPAENWCRGKAKISVYILLCPSLNPFRAEFLKLNPLKEIYLF